MTLDQRDLGILEALKPPTIEFETENSVFPGELSFDHLQDTGLACIPVAMHADGDGSMRTLAQQADDRRGDRFVIQQIDLGFVVCQEFVSLASSEYQPVPSRFGLNRAAAAAPTQSRMRSSPRRAEFEPLQDLVQTLQELGLIRKQDRPAKQGQTRWARSPSRSASPLAINAR